MFLNQRPCVAEPEATLPSSAEPRALRSPTRTSAHSSPPLNFLAAAFHFFLSTATVLDKGTYSMPKHFPCSGMDFLIFNFSWTLHSFPSIWKTSSSNIIPINKMGKHLDSPASFRPISITSCVSKLFERIILSRLLFFLESNFILSPRQAGFRPGRSTFDQILHLLQSPSKMSLTNSGQALARSFLLLTSRKLLTFSGIPPFSINSFRLASLLALLVGLNLSSLIGALAWLFKITKVVPIESVQVFRKDPFLALYFSCFSSTIFRILCLLPSAVLYTLTIWPFGPLFPRFLLRWRPHKELCFDWSAD